MLRRFPDLEIFGSSRNIAFIVARRWKTHPIGRCWRMSRPIWSLPIRHTGAAWACVMATTPMSVITGIAALTRFPRKTRKSPIGRPGKNGSSNTVLRPFKQSPVAIGFYLVDEDGAVLASVSGQVPLSVAVNVEPPHHAPTLDRCLPNGGVNSLPSPRDVARQAHIDRKQARRHSLLPVAMTLLVPLKGRELRRWSV